MFWHISNYFSLKFYIFYENINFLIFNIKRCLNFLSDAFKINLYFSQRNYLPKVYETQIVCKGLLQGSTPLPCSASFFWFF